MVTHIPKQASRRETAPDTGDHCSQNQMQGCVAVRVLTDAALANPGREDLADQANKAAELLGKTACGPSCPRAAVRAAVPVGFN